MLTPLRNMLRSKASGGIFVLLIVAMAAWGVTDIFAGGGGANFVSVGERDVSSRAFDAQVERVLRRATDDRGRSLTKEEALEQGIIDEVFQDLLSQTILTAYADEQGISATTGAIAEAIGTDPVFQDTTGVFDSERYEQLLRDSGYFQEDYEATIEAEMTIRRLQNLPITGLKVPTALARLQAAYTGELRSASWFILQQSELPEIGDPTEDELRELYDTRQDILREPERRAISLIQLSADDYVAQSDVLDVDIEAYYEAYKTQRYTGPDSRSFTEFRFPDERTARNALGRIAGGAAADAIETATSTELKSGRRELIANERLAEQVFSPGAQVGSIHGPQPVGNEFLVIRLETITPGAATPLEAVRDEIESQLAREQAESLFYDALPQFDDLIGTGATLEGIAEGLGTPVLSFSPVDTNGVTKDGARYLPLVTAPGLLEMVYDRAEGKTTERFGDDDVTWLARIDKIVPERLPEFEEVRETLEFVWRQQQQSEQLQAVASEIEAAIAEDTTTLAAEAAKYASTMDSLPRPITRTNTDMNIPRPLIDGMFEANAVGETFSIQGLPGQMIIMQVTSIDRPDSETLDLLAQSSSLEIQNSIAEDLYRAYLISINRETDLNSNAGAFEAYKRGLVTQQ
ncbi:MAG: SurA N-terminal domain-containing protein [Pseudomonadota bacterium]